MNMFNKKKRNYTIYIYRLFAEFIVQIGNSLPDKKLEAGEERRIKYSWEFGTEEDNPLFSYDMEGIFKQLHTDFSNENMNDVKPLYVYLCELCNHTLAVHTCLTQKAFSLLVRYFNQNGELVRNLSKLSFISNIEEYQTYAHIKKLTIKLQYEFRKFDVRIIFNIYIYLYIYMHTIDILRVGQNG